MARRPAAALAAMAKAVSPRAGIPVAATPVDQREGGRPVAQRGEQRVQRGALPSASMTTPDSSLPTKPAEPQLPGQTVDERPEPHALHDPADADPQPRTDPDAGQRSPSARCTSSHSTW